MQRESFVVLVCGGCDYTNKRHVFKVLDALHEKHTITRIIEGNQRTYDDERRIVGGADWFGCLWG